MSFSVKPMSFAYFDTFGVEIGQFFKSLKLYISVIIQCLSNSRRNELKKDSDETLNIDRTLKIGQFCKLLIYYYKFDV